MSSEQLADGVNPLDAELAATWDVLKGYSGRDTDLGIARRFGGAAAAYSLRDIGAMNGRVVKVRRDVDGDGTDKEEDFSANQVQSGALEDWVNGKLESTLPADVATAAAAYSLRKVKADYSGDAVRIRRIDNTEVDVAFDSEGKVSTSSSITNIASGDVDNTSETTLGNFLQGEADVRALFNSSAYFPTDSDYFSLGSGITLSGAFTISYDVVFTGEFSTNTSRIFQDDAGNDLLTFTASDVCKFRVDGVVRTMSALSTALQLGRKYSMIFARDGSGNYTLTIDGVQVSTLSGTDTDDFLIQRIGFRNRGSISNLNINSGQHIYAGNGAENSNWTDTGSGTTTNATKVGSPVLFTGQGMDSFVDTWYDQAGSNDAVQETAANQPKIAENGALLADGVSFDGDFFLQKTTTDTTTTASIFGVHTKGTATGSGARPIGYQESLTTNTNSLAFAMDNSIRFDGDAATTSTQTIPTSGLFLATTIKVSNTEANNFINSVSNIADNALTLNDTDVRFTLGFASTTPDYSYDGSIQEAIFYNSDQSDNRFKIESNINNYYGLYTFQGDGFVETWYDQSANLRDAIQETATNQPKIVSNGGIVKVNSKPAITFDGNDNFLEVDGSGSAVAYSFSPSGDMGMFIVYKASVGNVIDSRDGAGDGIFLQQSSGNDTRFRYNGDGSINITATRDAQHFNTMTLDGTTLSASVDGGTAGTDTVTAGVSTTSNLVLGKAFSGNNSNFVDGEIQEAIFYENNKTSEKSDIETDIDNFYSIT